jgi:peptide/nickel transport system permease protein
MFSTGRSTHASALALGAERAAVTDIGANVTVDQATADYPDAQTGWARTAEAWRALASNRLVLIGSVIALAYVFLGIFGPMLAPYDYRAQNLADAFLPPFSSGHILGTDQLGRDMLSRVLEALRISLLVGVVVTSASLVIGGLMGVLAGYFGGKGDKAISALIDITWGFPLILVAVLLVGALGPGLTAMMLAVGIINWAGFARIIRGETLALRQREFVEAAKALGVPRRRIIRRHILPHTIPVALVMTSYYVALAVIFEAGFSFIGLGAQPPLPSLGQMIAEGRNYMLVSHWVITVPGVTIALIVIGLNLLGDGLRDIFDPRLHDR